MDIRPFVSIGELRFGESRDNVRGQLGGTFVTFRKGGGKSSTDAYNELGLHLYFDANDKLEFVEAFSPAEIYIFGIALLGRDQEKVGELLAVRGYEFVRDDVGLQFNALGLGFTAPEGVIEGVALFKRGYYGE